MHSFPTADHSTLRSSSLPARAAASLVALGVGVIGFPASAHAQCPVSFAPAVNYASAVNPTSVALGDFNADGKLDMQIANGLSGTVRCLLGTGTGTFTDNGQVSVGTQPLSIAVGDFNGDGRPDFVTANQSSDNVSVRLGLGNGFTSAAVNYTAGIDPVSVAVGDFNGDGRADLAVANFASNNVSVLLGNGNGTFGAATNFGVGVFPRSVAVGDVNGDGRADLAVANDSSNNVSVLLGNVNPPGTFAAAVNYGVGTLPLSVAVADFNGDGRADLVTANDSSNNVSVLLGNGNGTFAAAVNFAVGSHPYSVAAGDFNGDGRADLAAANNVSNNVSVLLNNTPGNPLPVFTIQPVGRVAQTGASVSLTASANFFGGPTPYQWRRNGQPLSNGGNISGATTGTLTIDPVSASDEAVYDVQAISGACNGVQSSATSITAVLAVTTPVTINNDNCSAAKLIGNSFYVFSTGGATTDGPTEANLGFGGGDLQVHNDVWFIYAATCSGVVTVDLCTSAFNTKVAIYSGNSCPAAPNTAIAGNDDTACETGDFQSHATFTAVAGGQYLIRVGGYQGAVGTAGMNVSCNPNACLAADMGVQGGIPGRDNLLDNNDFIVFIDNFFNQTQCP